jgi:hypothetical protein
MISSGESMWYGLESQITFDRHVPSRKGRLRKKKHSCFYNFFLPGDCCSHFVTMRKKAKEREGHLAMSSFSKLPSKPPDCFLFKINFLIL